MDQHIYLIGFMGTGKSTVSRSMSHLAGVPAYEMDKLIEKECGMKISDIFLKYGEVYFRDRETEMCRKIAQMSPAVVSCGGGAVLRTVNVELMKASGQIVLLTASVQTILARIGASENRPVLNGRMDEDSIRTLMNEREGAYRSACDLVVSTDGKTPDSIAAEILSLTAG